MSIIERDPSDVDPIELEDDQDEQDDGNNGAGGDDDGGKDDSAIEARARRMGWIPEAEWDDARAEKDGRRRPAKFFTAEEYIAQAETSLPMLRAELRKMDAKLSDANKQTAEMYEVIQEQRKLQLEAIERVRKEERERLEREREQAVAEGDVEAFKAAEGKLKTMDAPSGSGEQQQGRAEEPEVAAFKAANKTWFTVDQRMTNNMIDEFAEVKGEMPNASLGEQLAEAKKRLQRRFPEKFGINPRRENARPGVTPPTGSREGGAAERSFSSLSPETQAIYHRAAKIAERAGAKLSKAEWLKEIGM